MCVISSVCVCKGERERERERERKRERAGGPGWCWRPRTRRCYTPPSSPPTGDSDMPSQPPTGDSDMSSQPPTGDSESVRSAVLLRSLVPSARPVHLWAASLPPAGDSERPSVAWLSGPGAPNLPLKACRRVSAGGGPACPIKSLPCTPGNRPRSRAGCNEESPPLINPARTPGKGPLADWCRRTVGGALGWDGRRRCSWRL